MADRILQASFFYRLYSRIVESLSKAARESGIWRLCAFLISGFRTLLTGSAIVRFFTRLADKVGHAIRESMLLGRFMYLGKGPSVSISSLFYKAYNWLVTLFGAIFRAIRLDRLLAGSIFTKPLIWCAAAVALAPIAPTKVVIALAALSIVSLILEQILDAEKRLIYFPINKYIWLFALAYGLAILASVTRSGSLFPGLVTICFILIFFVLTNSVRKKSQLRGVLIAMVWAGALVALYGFYQFIFQENFISGWVDVNMFSGMFRVYSTLGNPNVLGEYFLLIIPFALALLITAKSRGGRLFYIAALLAMLACLVLTYSRGCYLGILVGAAIFLILLDRRFIFPGLVAICLMVLVMPASIVERFTSIGNMSDSSTSYRVMIWLGTIAMLKNYWFSGVGPGEAAYAKVYPVYAYNTVSAPHAHNLFLQITCDTGVSGLILLVVIFYQYFKTMFATVSREQSGEARIFAIAGISAIAGFLVQSMTDYTFYNYRVMFLFWAVLGISVLVTKYHDLEE